MTDSVIAAAREWIAGDPDAETRSELDELIAAGDVGELAERMAGTLQFGTAGLRGAVGAGSNRMNRAVVIRATRGLADYLLARPDAGPVVVGRDARLSSETFMDDTVAVLVAAGLDVRYFPDPAPTPLVAFASRTLGARAAVVITASHNPPADNGYKVYAANGAQIIPPADGEIAAAIAATGPAAGIPRVAGPLEAADPIGPEVFDAYLAELETARPEVDGDRSLSIVYTPLHGVGWRYVAGAMEHAGYRGVHVVPEQAEPDGRFPTVAFPNPEEPGALDLAMALAGRVGADLVLANDPDVDRLAAAVRRDEAWRQLTGNQIGVLLADFVLEHTTEPNPLVVSSIVSSPMLGSIAAEYGARFEQTLTGFKWIWNAALDLAATDRYVFGYEEALGYSVGGAVRDKDGISALVVFADLAAACAARGSTLLDRLAGLYRRHGLWVSIQKSVVRPGTEGQAEIAAAMDRIQGERPDRLGGREVVAVTDYATGAEQRPRWLPSTSLVEIRFDAGRALIRPSGTEPKLKIYVDLRREMSPGAELDAAESATLEEAAGVADDLAGFVGLD